MRPPLRTTALLLALALSAPALTRSQELIPRVPARVDPADTASIEPAAAPEEEFPAALGSFTTTLRGSRPERTANVRLAVAALDGQVIEPGQTISFNTVVGARTAERGYQSAPVILHETRQLQVGGGVCQVASTMFVAGLLSGLSTVERWRHSSPVDYIALGEDATIAWGAKDLRLRNDTGQRVRLRVLVRGTTLSAQFQGEESPRETFELLTEERELPAEPGVADARPGREIELYRVRRMGHEGEVRELVHRDVYPPSRGPQSEP
jgi:vancomycin resistance protein YoaR